MGQGRHQKPGQLDPTRFENFLFFEAVVFLYNAANFKPPYEFLKLGFGLVGLMFSSMLPISSVRKTSLVSWCPQHRVIAKSDSHRRWPFDDFVLFCFCRQVCADIAETSVTVDAHERYKRMLSRRRRNGGPHFKADFIAADCTKTRLLDLYPRKVRNFDWPGIKNQTIFEPFSCYTL